MTYQSEEPTAQRWVQVNIGRPGFLMSMAGLFAGAALYFAGQSVLSRQILAITFGLLIALPMTNVLGIVIEETRRRDWPFAAAGVIVLSLLSYRLLA